MKIDFIECNAPITMDNLHHFAQFGDLLLLRAIDKNGNEEYGVLKYVTTGNGGKLGIYDGHFFYDFAGGITVTGYITLEV